MTTVIEPGATTIDGGWTPNIGTPAGVAVDTKGRIFVSDLATNSIEMLTIAAATAGDAGLSGTGLSDAGPSDAGPFDAG